MGVLSSLKKFIFGDGSSTSTTSFYKLYNKLISWQENKVFPPEYELPDEISFPPDFWSKVEQLHKLTRSDRHERAISVFWADGDLIVSSVVKGSERAVTPRANVSVRYSPSSYSDYYTKEVRLNDKLYSKKDIYKTKVPKTVTVKYLFNMHTHPPHGEGDRLYYSFFSLQDINSLLGSSAVITGMIGDKLWILVRTNQTPSSVGNLQEREISPESLEKRLSIGVYVGELNGKLRRVGKKYEGQNNTT